ncbi:unnamed protein product [Symbiodinium sp. CCMP2456]|nr:unnamed protein product [Symbiodinium sp. CCMP2456]
MPVKLRRDRSSLVKKHAATVLAAWGSPVAQHEASPARFAEAQWQSTVMALVATLRKSSVDSEASTVVPEETERQSSVQPLEPVLLEQVLAVLAVALAWMMPLPLCMGCATFLKGRRGATPAILLALLLRSYRRRTVPRITS